jgi:hypothetical protein
MQTPQQEKQAIVIVKPRVGNKSAGLVRSIQSARIKRKVPKSIGSVSRDANLETGDGITMNKPYAFEDLTPEDRKKIADWLVEAKSATPKERPGFASLDAKLERVLALLTSDITLNQVQTRIEASATDVPTAALASALDRLELAIEEAVAEVRALYDQYSAAGVRPTNVGHAQTTPKNSANLMDQLQARVNRIRFETLAQFPKGCQHIGIIKKGASDK